MKHGKKFAPVALILCCLHASWLRSQNPGSVVPAQSQVSRPAFASPSIGVPPADYKLGPGDSLRVTVWTGADYQEQVLMVAPDGTLFIPFMANRIVNVTGMTAQQIRDLIQEELKRIYLQPVVHVAVVGFESSRAVLVGEVANPGQFPIFGNTRILEFIAQHGGFSERANLAEVLIRRAGAEQLKVNVFDVILKGDQSQNVLLQAGDTVYVPSLETISKRYFMLGELRVPQVLQTPQDLNLLEAIARSGTLTPSAQAKHVFVIRQGSSGAAEVMDINLTALYKKGDFSQNVPLKSGDIIYVPKNPRVKFTDLLNAVSPLLGFIRDTLLIVDVSRR
ncbi:MAG TPA: polysaccharide biosynthesis/export family protein [Acidobacteriota bacterium]|jgi:polysaccharide export outer membrane protein